MNLTDPVQILEPADGDAADDSENDVPTVIEIDGEESEEGEESEMGK